MADNRELGHLAAAHLLERGYRSFGCLASLRQPAFRLRAQGFIAAITAAGHECFLRHFGQGDSIRFGPGQSGDRLDPPPHESADGGVRGAIIARWLQDMPKPAGLMAPTDRTAQSVMRECVATGVLVPEDVALIGCANDHLICESLTPALTSVDQNPTRIGYEAARLLDRLLQGEPPPEKPLLVTPRGVVCRASTDGIAVKDAMVREALRFMERRLAEPIGIGDICAHVGASHTTLEPRMRKALGRTLNAQLLHLRLECAKGLMLETDFRLERIARLSGFHLSYFRHVFTKHVGTPPALWRQERRHTGEGGVFPLSDEA
jgi:LacI family transcriptional regulator